MHGAGTYTYPSGDVYKGGFEAGLKQGSGTYVFKVSQSALHLTDTRLHLTHMAGHGPARFSNRRHEACMLCKMHGTTDNLLGPPTHHTAAGCAPHFPAIVLAPVRIVTAC